MTNIQNRNVHVTLRQQIKKDMKKVKNRVYSGTICFIVVLLLSVYPHSHAAQSTLVNLALIADKASG
ncbi:hypothetical protein KA005_82210, partial [bacterium]|nr:hypothetical protein [bacterium]